MATEPSLTDAPDPSTSSTLPTLPTLPTQTLPTQALPAQALPAQALPAQALPTLPALPTPSTLAAPGGPAIEPVPTDPISLRIPPLSAPSVFEPTAVGGGPSARPRSSRRWPLLTLVAVTLLAAAAAAFVVLRDDGPSRDDSPAPAPVEETPVEQPTEPAPVDSVAVDDASSRSDNPLIQPIDDARSAVDLINDNSGEAEILGELGLDPEGNPISPQD